MKLFLPIILVFLYTIDTSWSWRTIEDIDDIAPTTQTKLPNTDDDTWKWENSNYNNQDGGGTQDDDQVDDDDDYGDNYEEDDNDDEIPQKLQPLQNNDWAWQSSTTEKYENQNHNINSIQSHRKKKGFSFDTASINPQYPTRSGIPKLSINLYKAILGESQSFQEVVDSILNPRRILEEYYAIFSNDIFQQKVQQGNLDEAKQLIEEKLCQLGLMKCIYNDDSNDDYNNNQINQYTKPFVFKNSKFKRETKKLSETGRQNTGTNSRLTFNNYGSYGNTDPNVGSLGNVGGLGNLASLSNLPQSFASLALKNIAPTFGFSFGLPIPAGAYPFNAIGGAVPAVNPYFGSISPNGVRLGLINVNPLVSVQYTKDEYGDKIVKPLVHLHITPNENILQKVGGFLKSKKKEALYNYHHHVHEHDYPPIIPGGPGIISGGPPHSHDYPPIISGGQGIISGGPPHSPIPPYRYDHIPSAPPAALHYDHFPTGPGSPYVNHVPGPIHYNPTPTAFHSPIQYDHIPHGPATLYSPDYQNKQHPTPLYNPEYQHTQHSTPLYSPDYQQNQQQFQLDQQILQQQIEHNQHVQQQEHHIHQKEQQQQQVQQQHHHNHYYDDFNSKFISSGDPSSIHNYQYGLFYPYTKDSVVKTHLSDVAPIDYHQDSDNIPTGYGNGGLNYQTIATSGYQTGYPSSYEDYYGITSKLDNRKSKSLSPENSKFKFPEGRTEQNQNIKNNRKKSANSQKGSNKKSRRLRRLINNN